MAKINVTNIAIDASIKEILKQTAEKQEISVGKVVKNLVDKYLVVDNSVVPVIIKIPSNLKNDPANLKIWLDHRVAGIIKALCQ